MRFKVLQSFSDIAFNEQAITQWMRETLECPAQYDFTVFNGTKGKLNRTVDLVVWFKIKADAEAFKDRWSR
jgi:hypothetical protein